MAKKQAQHRAKRRTAAKKADVSRKLSETITDFGRPLIAKIEKGWTQQTVHDLFQIIVIIWNAHVRAMPAWGHPESLKTLRESANDEKLPELMRYAIGALSLRRLQRFADDDRAVDDWAVSYDRDQGTLQFGCKALLPPGRAAAGQGEPDTGSKGEPEIEA